MGGFGLQVGGLVRVLETVMARNLEGGITGAALLEGDTAEVIAVHPDGSVTVGSYQLGQVGTCPADNLEPIELDKELVADLAYRGREAEREIARLVWAMNEQAKIIAEKDEAIRSLEAEARAMDRRLVEGE